MEFTEDLVTFDFDIHSLGTELIDTFSLSDEKLGESMRIVGCVDVLSDLAVNGIVRKGNIHCTLVLQFDDQFLQVQDVLC